MTAVAFWLDARTVSDRTVFMGVAEQVAGGDRVCLVGSGRELVDAVRRLEATIGPVDHVVIAGHGGPTWLLDDKHGVTTREPTHAGQVSVYELAATLAPLLRGGRCLVSLAACLCSRSPRWFLRRRWAHVGSDWGRRAYLPGGEASFSARLRDGLWWDGVRADVRGHRASGRATACALLARHRGPAGEACESLFRIALPGVEPTRAVRRRWVGIVTGELAERWLLGDDEAIEEIRREF